MARNLEVSIRIEMNETDAPLSANSEEAEAISSGHFRLVLDIALMAKSDVLSLRTTMFATSMDELHFMVSMRCLFERGSNGVKQQVSKRMPSYMEFWTAVTAKRLSHQQSGCPAAS